MKTSQLFIVSLLSLTCCFVLAKDTITILPLGDSITQGGSTFTCYREILAPQFRTEKRPFKFIGPNRDSTSAHAGFGGKNTHYLANISEEIYRKYPADIVMIHSGHNSFSKDLPVPGIISDTKRIIENIRDINPEVTILLAQVIPAGKLPKYSYIPELNREFKKLAEQMKDQRSVIVLVDQSDGFDWKTDTIADKVHPNQKGAEKMAARWMEALLPLSIR
ncbi:MAG: GDSL-type esterase/lipase family protein [Verrucomicrobiales bacterium]|nr:GDSL-type esterase/lipase family protein [Verrucomicrobiales bacterium]